MTTAGTDVKKTVSLKDCCVYFDKSCTEDTNYGEVDKFVGIKCINNELKIYFPVGYKEEPNENDKAIRKNVLNLVSVLSSFSEKFGMLTAADILSSSKEVQFPIHAYLFIISDFLNRGYYTKKESQYRKDISGKINWSRTIKHIRPQICNEDAVYFNFITRHTDYNQSQLISQIHRYCVYESFTKIGYLFSSFVPQKPAIKFNKTLFTAIVRNEAANTFNENNLLLFKNMIDVINYLDDSNENENYIFGTNNFHHIWEALVDSVYGESDKDNYYPKVYWKRKGEEVFDSSNSKYNSLRPDTIMITQRGKPEQKIFVLDSKYYRYGATSNPSHLPVSESVVKQFAYAQYIDKQCSPEEKATCRIPQDIQQQTTSQNIYNAFIMPADCEAPQNIGYVSADYSLSQKLTTPKHSYDKIYGILLDVKTLMFNHIPQDKEAIAILAKAIERC